MRLTVSILIALGIGILCPARAQLIGVLEQGDSTVLSPLLDKLSYNFFRNPDSTVIYGEKLITIAEKTDNPVVIKAIRSQMKN